MNIKLILCLLALGSIVTFAGIALADQQQKDISIGDPISGTIQFFEQIYHLFLKLSLPPSLDSIYEGSEPERVGNPYLGEMFVLVGQFAGIALNVQQGDFDNAKTNFDAFSDEYDKVSKMVPEWKGYFDKKLVAKIGEDIENQDAQKTLKDLGELEEKCEMCHRNNKPQVWIKYFWKDFRTVKVETPNGEVPWPNGMEFIAAMFDGATINLAEGKNQQAIESAQAFQAMFPPKLKEACNQCHNSERKYYVTQDVVDMVDQYVSEIEAGNLQNAQALQGQIGEQCMKCHIVHEGQQRIKEMMDN